MIGMDIRQPLLEDGIDSLQVLELSLELLDRALAVIQVVPDCIPCAQGLVGCL